MTGNVFSLTSLVAASNDNAAAILDAPPALIEMLPLAVYACDADGRIRWFNGKAVEMWGRAPNIGDLEERFCGSQTMYDLDGRFTPHQEIPMAQVLKTGVAIDGQQAVIERPDGSRVTAMVHISPIKDAAGRLLGAINCFHDVSELRNAQQALREREQWYHGLLEALPAAIYTTDTTGRITFYNQGSVEFSGRRPDVGADEWCVSWRLYTTDGTPMRHDECPMAVALKDVRPLRGAEAIAERPDGTRLSFAAYPTPLHDKSGRLTGAINMLVDITERKMAERRLALVAREVDHRAKNMLAVIQAMVRFTRAESVSEFAAAILGRISALAHAHTLLSESRWEGADLRRLVMEELAPYRSQDEARVHWDGPTVALVPPLAQSLAIILHELTTNAVKYGALSTPAGRVSIRWRRDADGGLVLDWRERGTAPVSPPSRHGFGMNVIKRTIEDQLDGSLRLGWTAEGLSCSLLVPAASLAQR